jgi:hypothetical protein
MGSYGDISPIVRNINEVHHLRTLCRHLNRHIRPGLSQALEHMASRQAELVADISSVRNV